ncbi:MAG: EamA family transporter [Varibaculum sp.]|nr:EamA family transporter [Varibaculum sp.]
MVKGEALPADASSAARWHPAVAPGLVLASSAIMYLGAALAVLLFAVANTGAVAWGRIGFAALLLLLWRRPRIQPRYLPRIAVFGLALTGMNVLFYFAISMVPLGSAVAVEFLGPVVLAALRGHGVRTRIAVLFGLLGVFLISWEGVRGHAETLIGMSFALAAGALWAVYIWLGERVATTAATGVDSLALGMGIGALVLSPLVIGRIDPFVEHPVNILLILLVALFSSVLPYALDMVLLSRIPATTYAVLTALFPATSLLVGLVMLRQVPTLPEVLGLAMVSVAVWLAACD